MKPLLSARYVAHQIGVPLIELQQLARDTHIHYRQWSSIDEKKNKARNFKAPDKKLKAVQRRILRRLLNAYALPEGAHGGVKGKSPKTNASEHCGKPLVVTSDIRSFFPSVSHREVAKMFKREFGCGRYTTWLLTRLTTIDGQLPQGAPTSTAIANILLASTVDRPAELIASKRDVTVTRFVDDFAFSGVNADTLINSTARSASNVGLRTWRDRKKLKIMPASRRQEVTGLNVNSPDGPSVPCEKRERGRAAIHPLKKAAPGEIDKALVSIRGRVNHVRQFNKGSADRLESQLGRVLGDLRNE